VIFVAWLPVVCFLCLLAVESTPAFGADRTSLPLQTALHAVAGRAVDRNWTLLHHLIRKTGHFLGYGLLSMLLFRAIRMTGAVKAFLAGAATYLAALSLTFIVAGMDEWHQAFLPNRTGKFSDVLLDTAGAAAMLLAMCAAGRAARVLYGCRRPAVGRKPNRTIEYATGDSGRATAAA